MSGKALLITGASRGIGAASAHLAAEAGWHVAVNFRADRQAADSVVEAIRQAGGTAIAIQADVSEPDAIALLFDKVEAALGPIGGLVNNAGIVDIKARVDDFDAARLERMFRTNTIAPMLAAGEAVRRMSTRHGAMGGVIVNVSSVAATLGSPGEYVDYAASKAAIDTFTRGLALEVAGEGIRVNAVRPGIIDTEIHASGGQPDRIGRISPLVPLKRAGTPDEVAQTIVWLLSDKASYMTGSIIDVSGGR